MTDSVRHSETASLSQETIMRSRLTDRKGRELFKVMQNNNLKHLSTRQPTYWPSDPNKIPDLLDFCVTKGIHTKKLAVASCLELTSGHTPILITVFTHTRKTKETVVIQQKNLTGIALEKLSMNK
jgi:hypothetical protein